MEIKIWPNLSRPGGGQKPRREGQRPLLPQHARQCPVLEAGNTLGYLVYPPLEKNEAFYVEFLGDGKFEFKYFMANVAGGWDPMFAVGFSLPVGGVGTLDSEVRFALKDAPVTEEGAVRMASAFFVPEDLGTPPGAVTLRGAYNFQTPHGWDSVYVSVLNHIERPVAPVMTVRVETDWYAHHSEFRYVLQPGEGLSGSQSLPIGQVFFVPREDPVLLDVTEAELTEIKERREKFLQEKVEHRTTTRYGLQYSPHYVRTSKAMRELDKGK